MSLMSQELTHEIKTLHNGRTVMFLMATAAEYQTELKKLIGPAIIGVGPVEAALNTGRILSTSDALPDIVVLLGSSGSATLAQGEIYQASSLSYRDMDATPLGFERGQTPFLDQKPTIEVSHRVPGIPKASLSTGGNIILTEGFADLDEETKTGQSFCQPWTRT